MKRRISCMPEVAMAAAGGGLVLAITGGLAASGLAMPSMLSSPADIPAEQGI